MLCSDPLLDSHRYKDIIEEAIAGGNFTGLFRKFPFFFSLLVFYIKSWLILYPLKIDF